MAEGDEEGPLRRWFKQLLDLLYMSLLVSELRAF